MVKSLAIRETDPGEKSVEFIADYTGLKGSWHVKQHGMGVIEKEIRPAFSLDQLLDQEWNNNSVSLPAKYYFVLDSQPRIR